MNSQNKIWLWLIVIISLIINSSDLIAEDNIIAKVQVTETAGLARSLEYIDVQFQLKFEGAKPNLNIIAEDPQSGEQTPCQIFNKRVFEKEKVILLNIIFPSAFKANERKIFILKVVEENTSIVTDLKLTGGGLDLIIDNIYYRANLSKSNQSEAKSFNSGQLCDLLIKKKFNQLLFRTENRMHWAPNFQKPGLEYYETIAGWQNPKHYIVYEGDYLIFTQRQDLAPEHSEILLTANYTFYAGLPYFKFFSSMDIINDVTLSLLRNDEMTMDSMFTHVAFQNNAGKIIDLAFPKRYKELEENPIENNSPWVCFYNINKGYAFGSIRIKYDNTNKSGLPSPTHHPHTRISDGAEGGKYWNRCLIDAYPIFVPKGSSYREENAYLLFEINKENKFKEIIEQMNIIKNPVEVSFIQ